VNTNNSTVYRHIPLQIIEIKCLIVWHFYNSGQDLFTRDRSDLASDLAKLFTNLYSARFTIIVRNVSLAPPAPKNKGADGTKIALCYVVSPYVGQ